MSTQIILLERVENLGNMGDVVNVKPGYARNFLLPKKKALRANKENIAYFEAQKKHIQAESDKAKAAAEKVAKKVADITVSVIRQASESGQLYGSVNAKDIAVQVAEKSKESIDRSMVELNQNFKQIGLFPVSVRLHPEVKVDVTVNIARTAEEAEIQEKTGKAMISDDVATKAPEAETTSETDDTQLEEVLEEGALEAEKEKQAAKAQAAAEEAEKKVAKEAKDAEAAEAKAAAEAELAEAEENAEESSDEKSEEKDA